MVLVEGRTLGAENGRKTMKKNHVNVGKTRNNSVFFWIKHQGVLYKLSEVNLVV